MRGKWTAVEGRGGVIAGLKIAVSGGEDWARVSVDNAAKVWPSTRRAVATEGVLGVQISVACYGKWNDVDRGEAGTA